MPLDIHKPLSLTLGAGGVRGFAHIGVLEALVERGFTISEIVGTSAGAIIGAFYAAVGLSLPELRAFGLNLTSRHLLRWALLRRLPAATRKKYAHFAGIIPEHLERLAQASGHELHHGIERLGVVCYDVKQRAEVFFHNQQEGFPLEEAARGSAAIPGFFPSRRCVVEGREYRLVDGGVINKLPVDKLFVAPFQPAQILAVDVSNVQAIRELNRTKIAALQQQHPDVPIVTITPDLLGRGTILYRQRELLEIVEAGKRSLAQLL
ncbi:MAG TPA: patatin-like phospholipase family protein [Blastocatellia bacterium]|nr:patatin-like phospholipase family protein [Blastocatellia bacterium]